MLNQSEVQLASLAVREIRTAVSNSLLARAYCLLSMKTMPRSTCASRIPGSSLTALANADAKPHHGIAVRVAHTLCAADRIALYQTVDDLGAAFGGEAVDHLRPHA